ncbi:esterase family protein [Gynurincola endophyticus]|uniref:esterase family protein n=1 Tax=Gynurincola endophyticus TaxID=2479004 RepID=UPI0018F4ECBC|nr:alpha/beta hydrolase-fold protein [Gynurincola endophyticus]
MRHLHSWYSQSLHTDMPIAVYGHYGHALLLVPTAAADYLEYERFQLIHSLWHLIEAGKIKVFSINSVNNESWMNAHVPGEWAIERHRQWNNYVYNEVIPFIKAQTSATTPIYVSGASFGALHSANLFFQRPDLFSGVIAMSGVYHLTEYTKGFYNEEVYYNSPNHYVSNLEDPQILQQIRSSNHIHLFSGSGDYEDPRATQNFSNVLHDKQIKHDCFIWGQEWKHDWDTWRKFLPILLEQSFE